MADFNSPFKTPAQSLYGVSPTPRHSSLYEASVRNGQQQVRQRRLQSARLVGEYEKPWIKDSPYKARERWDKVILWGCITVGFLIGVVLCYFAYAHVPKHQYCLLLDDNFENMDNWNHEIQVGGFGTGSFDWTTDDPLNSYVDSAGLHIVPTLTLNTTSITVDQMLNNYVLNLTTDGCTSSDQTQCSVRSNSTAGTIINPVRSARLTTQGKFSITYGRVEVVAKMPAGDWLWPAIWMMPEDSVYGSWPKSGEIDIVESRGNNPITYNGGRDTASSALHWGLDFNTDKFLQTTNKHYIRRSDYSKGFHTFGMEWSENYLYTYVDNRLLQILSVGFGGGKNMWSRSGLSKLYPSQDPWSQTGRDNTPFDQNFYLILNVAVGGTGGYFLDSVGNKPWVDWGSATAARDFWKAQSSWLPTWGEGDKRGMTVKSAKIWQQGACP